MRTRADNRAGLARKREIDLWVRRREDRVGRADDGTDSSLRHCGDGFYWNCCTIISKGIDVDFLWDVGGVVKMKKRIAT